MDDRYQNALTGEICSSALEEKHIVAAEKTCAAAVAEKYIAVAEVKGIFLVVAVAPTVLDFLSDAEEEHGTGQKACLCTTFPADQRSGRTQLILQICYRQHEAKMFFHVLGES